MDEISNLIGLVLPIAPKLAGLLGGPLVSVGLTLIAKYFGLPSANPKDILAHLQQNPDKQIELAKIEQQVQTNDNLADETVINDVEDAREKNAAKSPKNEMLIDIIGIMLISAFVVQCFMENLGLMDINNGDKLADMAFIIINYNWGASRKRPKKP